jgi:AcrR family transcriptional regulator
LVQAGKQDDEAVPLKARLTAAARDLLEREGDSALSLRAAARACGVSHMAPYRHFASKDELLAGVAEHGFHDLAAALDAASAQKGAQRGVAVLPGLGVGIAYVEFACANPALYRLMFGAQLAPCERFPGLIAAGQAAFARCVAGARLLGFDCPMPEEGEAPPAIAAAIWALVHGLSSLAIDGLIALPEGGEARTAFVGQVLIAAFSGPGLNKRA